MAAHAARRLAPAREVFRQFWPYTRGDRRLLLAGGLAAILVTVSELGTVAIFDVMTNRVLARGHLAGFWNLAAAWLAIAAAAAAATSGGGYLSSLAGERFVLRLRDHLFRRLQELAPDFLAAHRPGDLVVRLTEDVEMIEEFVASGAVSLVTSVISLLLLGSAAIAMSWQLAVAAFAAVPMFWLISRGFSRAFSRAAARERAASAAVTSVIEENLANHTLVQALGRENAESGRLHAEGLAWVRVRMTQTGLGSLYSPLVFLVETAAAIVVLGLGAWGIAQHRITLGGLLAFAAFSAYLYPPARHLSGLPVTAAEAAASGRRITEILQARPAVTDGPRRPVPTRSRGRIQFDQVSFRYPGAAQPAVAGLTFHAGPGQVLAVVGPSGAGKSTVARLLMRMYDPSHGSILLDGTDIRRLPLGALRRQITLLDQENLLFPGTIRDNIGYGRPAAGDAQIIAAARAAGAHEFITALPDGYGTLVGQRGRLLSGGQRQRIAFARAIVRDAPVLVLDEPTTGLDSASAARVRELLATAQAGRTTIVITHDPRLAAVADTVLTLRGPMTAPETFLTVPARPGARRPAAPGRAARARRRRPGPRE